MADNLVENLRRYEVSTPAPCGLVRAARAEIERLQAFVDDAFEAHGNLDLDVERVRNEREATDG